MDNHLLICACRSINAEFPKNQTHTLTRRGLPASACAAAGRAEPRSGPREQLSGGVSAGQLPRREGSALSQAVLLELPWSWEGRLGSFAPNLP